MNTKALKPGDKIALHYRRYPEGYSLVTVERVKPNGAVMLRDGRWFNPQGRRYHDRLSLVSLRDPVARVSLGLKPLAMGAAHDREAENA